MTDRASIIDRYVFAVARLLPRAQRDDIAAELRANLQSHVDEEEALRHQPLSEGEVLDILRNYGHPRDVAANYGARQYLIGPEVFPSYVAAVKMVLFVMAPVGLFITLMTVLLTEENLLLHVAEALWTTVTIGLVNVAIVTLTFACAGQALRLNRNREWNPEELPEIHLERPVRRSEAIGSLFGLTLALCWWMGVNRLAWHWFGMSPLPFEWTTVWTEIEYAAIAVIIASMGRAIVALARPNWTKVYTGAGAMLALLALLVLRRLVAAGTYVAVTDTTPGAASAEMLVLMLDRSIFVALVVGTIFAAASVVIQTFRFVRLYRFMLRPQG
jgi:hypothetical protein